MVKAWPVLALFPQNAKTLPRRDALPTPKKSSMFTEPVKMFIHCIGHMGWRLSQKLPLPQLPWLANKARVPFGMALREPVDKHITVFCKLPYVWRTINLHHCTTFFSAAQPFAGTHKVTKCQQGNILPESIRDTLGITNAQNHFGTPFKELGGFGGFSGWSDSAAKASCPLPTPHREGGHSGHSAQNG